MARRQACIESGYRYAFGGKRRWRASKDDLWDTVVGDKVCGRFVGRRRIDGATCVVVAHRGKYYAVTEQSVRWER